MVDGSLQRLETNYGCFPFRLGDDEFSLLFLLVDRIYPHYSRFVRAIKKRIVRMDVRSGGLTAGPQHVSLCHDGVMN
jgi:hypothetical protein